MKFRTILCPTDFSEASYESLHKATELAEGGSTEICVVYVEPAQAHGKDSGEAARTAEAVKNLCAVLEEHIGVGLRTQPVLRQGDTAIEIVRAARETGADLIVLTTHGAGADETDHPSLGSVAEDVLRHAPCPVLTLNAPASRTRRARRALNGTLNTFDRMKPTFLETSPKALHLDGD
jgi:universal stress protein A